MIDGPSWPGQPSLNQVQHRLKDTGTKHPLKGLQVNPWHYVEGSSPCKKFIGDYGMKVWMKLLRIIPKAMYETVYCSKDDDPFR
jgi:hypothetical protein